MDFIADFFGWVIIAYFVSIPFMWLWCSIIKLNAVKWRNAVTENASIGSIASITMWNVRKTS